MKIRAGDIEIKARGAFAERAYQGETSRQVLRMRLLEVPTPAQLATLCAGPVTLHDNAGNEISKHEGFNAVYECYLALVAPDDAELKMELELSAALARAAEAEAALATVQAEAEARQAPLSATPEPVIEEGGVS